MFERQVFAIKSLHLSLSHMKSGYIDKIAHLVSHTLSSLVLWCVRIQDPYPALEVFFKFCSRICDLKLVQFEFRADGNASISQPVKDGFNRLTELCLVRCLGDEVGFVKAVPLGNLRAFDSLSIEVTLAIAIKCPALIRIVSRPVFSNFRDIA